MKRIVRIGSWANFVIREQDLPELMNVFQNIKELDAEQKEQPVHITVTEEYDSIKENMKKELLKEGNKEVEKYKKWWLESEGKLAEEKAKHNA